MTSPYFSIIIPVYNTEKYLRECLDSILNQTFSDWECICVDDGSKDNSLQILQEYAAKDARFIVFHQENQGASVARNFAMQKVRGEYFTFVDSDDMVLPNGLAFWKKMLDETNADILFETTIIRFTNERIEQLCPIEGGIDTYTTAEAVRKFFFERYWGGTVGKIYKRISVKSFHFPVGIAACEDIYAFIQLFTRDYRWCFVDGSHYGYRKNPGGAHLLYSSTIALQRFIVLAEEFRIMKQCGFTAAEMKTVWIKNGFNYCYSVECYTMFAKSERYEFEKLIKVIADYMSYFPYNPFMWLRIYLTHGKIDFIVRNIETIYYRARTNTASIVRFLRKCFSLH